jgi:tetratricopeptide (TPR) repeat protein
VNDAVVAAAARLLEEADPGDADQVYRAVLVAMQHGLEAEAVGLAEAGAARHPGDARLWQVLGLAERKCDRLAAAVAALGTAAALAPADPLIAHTLARATLEAGLPALDLFERAVALAPADDSVLLGRVAAQFAAGRLDEAIAGLEAEVRTRPGWLHGHGSIARLRWVRGDRDGFTASYEAALAATPRDLALWCELIETLGHAALYDRMIETIERARAAAGNHLQLDVLAAVCRAERGDTARADALFAPLLPIGHVSLALRYLRHLLRAGRPDEALAFAAEWRERDPDDLLVPYRDAAWRLTGDPQWAKSGGDPRLIGVYDLADRLPPLAALAGRLRGLHLARHQPLEQSLRGGTQTDGALFSRIEPEIQALRALVVETVERHIAQLPAPPPPAPIRFSGSWSVRLIGDGFHINHVHPAGWISSALYVALPEGAMGGERHAGWLSLGEVDELGLDLPPIRLVEPKPGRLVLFPSTMWHGTRPFATGERLAVAFDVARPPATRHR